MTDRATRIDEGKALLFYRRLVVRLASVGV